jgi:hypothetical protein
MHRGITPGASGLIDSTLVSVAHVEAIARDRASPRGARSRKQLDQSEQHEPVACNTLVHLIATMLSVHAPLAEVFAIVCEHAVEIFP